MNKTKYLFIAFVAVFSLMLWGGRSPAEDNEWVEGAVQGYYQTTGWNGVEAGQLIGQKVYSPAGGDLGQISDLLIDRFDERIVLVILSDVPGFGSEFVAAPISALERTGQSIYQLNFGDRDIPIASTYQDPYAYELTRHRDTVGLSTIPSAIDSTWADSVYRFYGQTPYWTAVPRMVIMSYRAAEPSMGESLVMGKTSWALMGATVWSRNGIAVARIDDLVVDFKDGRVTLLVLDRVPGRGEAQVAVPFAELTMNGKPFALYMTEDRLAAAPGFNEFADVNDPQKVEDIYRYFGLQPYWSEGDSTMDEPASDY